MEAIVPGTGGQFPLFKCTVLSLRIDSRDGFSWQNLPGTSREVELDEFVLQSDLPDPLAQCCRQLIQLHGGIGMTDELIVGHHYKRLMLLGMLFGDEDYYTDRYIRLTK